jgi:nucleoside 2-deoxyribosyltransferase
MKKLYLACPYRHSDSKIMDLRFTLVNKKAAQLMDEGYIVFSPLSHSVPIDDYFSDDKGHDFWLNQDFPFVEWCDVLYVYQLFGWKESGGVQCEIEYAKKLGKEIIYGR